MEIQNPFQISWNNIPFNSFPDFFFSSISKYGGSLAMVDHESGVQWRYSEIKDWTEKCIHRLKELGVGSLSRVALVTTTTVEVIFIHLACSMLGATVVAINGLASVDDIWAYVDVSESTHAICETSLLSKVEDVRKKGTLRGMGRIKVTKTIDEILCDCKIEMTKKPLLKQSQRSTSSATIELPIDSNTLKDEDSARDSTENMSPITKSSLTQPFLMVFTSGTVGMPKPIIFHHQSLIVNLLQLCNPLYNHPTQKDRFLLPLNIHHLFGIISAYYALFCGSTLICIPKFTLQVLYEAIDRHKITHIHLSPYMVYSLATDPNLESIDFSSVKTINISGAPLDIQMARKVKSITKVEDMRQAYGMTELGGICTWSYINNDKIESVGVPLPGMLMKIVNLDTKGMCFPRQQGQLLVAGPQIFPAFYKNSKATSEIMDSNGYYKTGDLAWFDEDGYIYIVDRIKDTIKCKNTMLCPSEIESIIREHPAIDDCAVVGRPDHVSGECPAAFVVKNSAFPLLSTAEVRQHVAGQIATFKELRGGVFFISEIPRSICGKVIRRQLKGFWDRERQAVGNKDNNSNTTSGTSNGNKATLAKRMSVGSFSSVKPVPNHLQRKQSESKVSVKDTTQKETSKIPSSATSNNKTPRKVERKNIQNNIKK
uniref:Acyl-CoA synthetase family member 2, mitochondrial (inferred by orthology to a human protein) n=1 Tax=Strongyloides venezuelensis TaxID=75913 RepID=A0A0K0F2Q7_STRVS